MAPTAFTEDDDKKMGMPPALRMRLRKMYSGEDFRDSALLVKHINQTDKSYFRDKAEAMKNYKEGDAVETEIRAFVRTVNATLKQEKNKTKHKGAASKAAPPSNGKPKATKPKPTTSPSSSLEDLTEPPNCRGVFTTPDGSPLVRIPL